MRRAIAVLVCAAVGVALWLALTADRSEEASAPRSATVGATEVAARAPAAPEEAQLQGVESQPPARPTTRTLHLRLLRRPDDAAIASVAVAVESSATGSPRALRTTDAEGRITVAVSGTAAAITVDAAGFEPLVVPLPEDARALDVLLTPAAGLYGRVVFDGQPVEGAEVRLESIVRVLQSFDQASARRPTVSVYERPEMRALAVTNREGAYFLPCETRIPGPELHITATGSDGHAGILDVTRPRPNQPLEDIHLREIPRLVITVLDEEGQPIAGAFVSSPQNPRPYGSSRTGEHGTISFLAPQLPTTFRAGARGRVPGGMRIGERDVPWGTPVASCDQPVQLVLRSLPGVTLRVVDAETRLPIFLVRGSVELFQAGERVGGTGFQVDAQGDAWIPVVGYTEASGESGEAADSAHVRVSVSGTERYLTKESYVIDGHRLFASEPIEIALQPKPGSRCVRGRVVRDGAPVGGLQLGLKVQKRRDGARPRGWVYIRGHTDPEGRFALRWMPGTEAEVVAVYPHRPRNDVFGFLGPLGGREAGAKEHILELERSLPVAAILRNVVRSDRYCYYVSLTDGDVAIGTTINGLPLRVAEDGESPTTLLLPSDRRVSVTIGYRDAGGVWPNCSPPVEHDPSGGSRPLVFEVEPLFATVSGSVVGITAVEAEALAVAWVRQHDQSSRPVAVASDGTFLLTGVRRGQGHILVLRRREGRAFTLLTRHAVEIDEEVTGLRVEIDPSTLPTEPRRRR